MAEDHGAAVNEWVNVVRRARIGATTYSVALTIATYANPDGSRVYPGLARLAVQCEISYGSAKRAMRKLRTLGLIERVRQGSRRAGRADEYRLILHPELLDRVEVLDPEAERKAIEAVKEVERVGSARRYRTRVHGSPLTRESGFSGQRDTVSRVTRDPPPSISTLPVSDPPSISGDLPTHLKVVDPPQAAVDNPVSSLGKVGSALLASLASGTDDDVCSACGVLLDPGRVCGNRRCRAYGERTP